MDSNLTENQEENMFVQMIFIVFNLRQPPPRHRGQSLSQGQHQRQRKLQLRLQPHQRLLRRISHHRGHSQSLSSQISRIRKRKSTALEPGKNGMIYRGEDLHCNAGPQVTSLISMQYLTDTLSNQTGCSCSQGHRLHDLNPSQI